MLQDALESLVAAVDSDRTDVVKTVISDCIKCEENDEGDITIHELLSANCTKGGTLLHYATRKGTPDIIRALLTSGADPGIQNEASQTPVDLIESPEVEEVYNTELLQSVAQSSIGRICQLIGAGVKVNLHDSPHSKNTPLHWAASYGSLETVQCLIDRGAVINATNAEGCTPLHDAVQRGDTQIVEELLSNGADPTVKAISGKMEGKSPIDLAANKPQLLELFNKMSNVNLTNGYEDGPENENVEKVTHTLENITIEESKNTPNIPTTPVKELPSPSPTVTDTRLKYLWPKPQRLEQRATGMPFPVQEKLYVNIAPSQGHENEVFNIWDSKVRFIQQEGIVIHVEPVVLYSTPVTEVPCVLCQINHTLSQREQGYRIIVTSKMVRIISKDVAGMRYAVNTFLQLLSLCKDTGIPSLIIHDWPSLKYRGILLDISHGRIPHMNAMEEIVATLEYLKINQIFVYTRFKVIEDMNLWQCLYTMRELYILNQYCSRLGISLIPTLDIASTVDFTELDVLFQPFQKFLSCFTSRMVNIGPRLSTFILEILEDTSSIVIDNVGKVIPISNQETLLVCGYVFHDTQVNLNTLPLNICVMEYGFKADYDFNYVCSPYGYDGLPFYTCPGTAAWNTIAGCPEAAVSNIYKAIKCATSHDALGMLICDWSGLDHMTHKSTRWPGIVTGAGLAWNSSTHWDFLHDSLALILNLHVFNDASNTVGHIMVELGRAETFVLRCARDQTGIDKSDLPADKCSTLHRFLNQPSLVDLDNLSTDVFQRTMRHVRKCQNELTKTKSTMAVSCHGNVISELLLISDLILFACRIGRALVNIGRNPNPKPGGPQLSAINMGTDNLPATTRTDLANRLLGLIEEYKRVWLLESQSTCLEESVASLQALITQLIPKVQDTSTM